ncbi:MAG: hypothetical protein D6705_16235 [Deltaproteobacteria bacterium]|nr:MAG: hypothetical protein D6705_16235 [Deltaproteobacteria bacterium]
MFRASVLIGVFAPLFLACGSTPPHDEGASATTSQADPLVGYDVRVLRPRNEEPLASQFERQRRAAVAEGKHVVAYFSAKWCEACQRLDLELGNMHPRSAIGHVRILELIEEDWEAATRMNEFNDLRTRFSPAVGTYPWFVLLDAEGNAVEEMREAKARLEGLGLTPTVDLWFEGLAHGAGAGAHRAEGARAQAPGPQVAPAPAVPPSAGP